jgi:long-chain acyl-CoA synthetase
LAQGEYIAPEKIENILAARCKLVLQIYVHGDSLESTLVAVSIPDPETFLPFANAVAGTQVTLADRAGYRKLINNPMVNAAFMLELEKAGKAGGLRGFEFVKRLHLSTDMFSVENNMMTPTSKVRRPQVREYFLDKIQAMYEDIHSTAPSAKL